MVLVSVLVLAIDLWSWLCLGHGLVVFVLVTAVVVVLFPRSSVSKRYQGPRSYFEMGGGGISDSMFGWPGEAQDTLVERCLEHLALYFTSSNTGPWTTQQVHGALGDSLC